MTKSVVARQIFTEVSNNNFEKNLSSRSLLDSRGQSDGRKNMTKLRIAFCYNANTPKSTMLLPFLYDSLLGRFCWMIPCLVLISFCLKTTERWKNNSDRGKTEILGEKFVPLPGSAPQFPDEFGLGSNPGLYSETPASNNLSYYTALVK